MMLQSVQNALRVSTSFISFSISNQQCRLERPQVDNNHTDETCKSAEQRLPQPASTSSGLLHHAVGPSQSVMYTASKSSIGRLRPIRAISK